MISCQHFINLAGNVAIIIIIIIKPQSILFKKFVSCEEWLDPYFV